MYIHTILRQIDIWRSSTRTCPACGTNAQSHARCFGAVRALAGKLPQVSVGWRYGAKPVQDQVEYPLVNKHSYCTAIENGHL